MYILMFSSKAFVKLSFILLEEMQIPKEQDALDHMIK